MAHLLRARALTAAAALAALSGLAGGCARTAETVTVATTVHTGMTIPVATTAPQTVPTVARIPTGPATPSVPVEPPTGPGTTTAPEGFPNRAEARLLDRLPAATRNRCTRTDPGNRAPRAVASVSCDLRDIHNVTTYIETFPDVATMRRQYARARSDQGVGTQIGPCTQQGTRPPGETTWHNEGRKGVEGRVMCFRNDNRFWFVWTQENVRVVAWASSARLPSVRRYWLDHSNINP